MAGDTDHLEPRGMAAPVGHYSIRKLESERCDIAARIESIAVARNVISLHPTAIERLPARHRPRGRTVAAQPNRRGRRMHRYAAPPGLRPSWYTPGRTKPALKSKSAAACRNCWLRQRSPPVLPGLWW